MEYPRWKYAADKAPCLAMDAAHNSQLGADWHDTPAELLAATGHALVFGNESPNVGHVPGVKPEPAVEVPDFVSVEEIAEEELHDPPEDLDADELKLLYATKRKERDDNRS